MKLEPVPVPEPPFSNTGISEWHDLLHLLGYEICKPAIQ